MLLMWRLAVPAAMTSRPAISGYRNEQDRRFQGQPQRIPGIRKFRSFCLWSVMLRLPLLTPGHQNLPLGRAVPRPPITGTQPAVKVKPSTVARLLGSTMMAEPRDRRSSSAARVGDHWDAN